VACGAPPSRAAPGAKLTERRKVVKTAARGVKPGRAAQEARSVAFREAGKAAVDGDTPGRAKPGARSALGNMSVRAVTGCVGSRQPGLGSSMPLGVWAVDKAVFYADVVTVRCLITRGANPDYFSARYMWLR